MRELPARHRLRFAQPRQLLAEVPRRATKRRARPSAADRGLGGSISARSENTRAASGALAAPRPRICEVLIARIQRLLQLRGIGRRAIVQDDEIHRQALEPPVFMRAQQLFDDLKVASSSSMRTSTMGRSPEIPMGHRSGAPI